MNAEGQEVLLLLELRPVMVQYCRVKCMCVCVALGMLLVTLE